MKDFITKWGISYLVYPKNIKTKHLTRFGSPLNLGGAQFYVTDQEGLLEMAIDLEKAKYIYHRIIMQEIDLIHFKAGLYINQIKYNYQIDDIGIPEYLQILMNIKKKSDIQYYCKTISLNEMELYYLIHNYDKNKYHYISIFKEFVPIHLESKTEVNNDIKQSKLHKTSRKLRAILKERKYTHVHFFEREKEWHCFFFTYKNIEDDANNHWKNGPHIHYINNLWPEYSKEIIINSVNMRGAEINGAAHISFIPWSYPDLNNNEKLSIDMFEFPGALAFSTPSQSIINPPPPAHIATRGNLAPTIFLPPKFKPDIL